MHELKDRRTGSQADIVNQISPLSCPICRAESRPYYASDYGYFVCCTKSDYITKHSHKTCDEAITAWNSEIIAMRKTKGGAREK